MTSLGRDDLRRQLVRAQRSQSFPFRFQFFSVVGDEPPNRGCEDPGLDVQLCNFANCFPISSYLRSITLSQLVCLSWRDPICFPIDEQGVACGRIDEKKIDHSFDAVPLAHAPEKRELGVRYDSGTREEFPERGGWRSVREECPFAPGASRITRTQLQGVERGLPSRRAAD